VDFIENGPFGPAYAVAVDSTNDGVFLGSGGGSGVQKPPNTFLRPFGQLDTGVHIQQDHPIFRIPVGNAHMPGPSLYMMQLYPFV
jgi:hypothetical protein